MLNFFAPINHLGYGIFSYHLIRAFDRHVSRDVALYAVPSADFEDELTRRWIENGRRFRRDDPSIMVYPASALNGFCGQPMMGFPIFEDDVLPERNLQILRQLDVLLQPSRWGKMVLQKQGVSNVHVVPGGYDPETYFPSIGLEEKLGRIEKRGISFVHLGKLEARKSSEEILRCFCHAGEDIRQQINLMFHVCNPFDDHWLEKVQRLLQTEGFNQSGAHFTKGHCHVVVPQGRIRMEEVRELYRMADFGIWASKAEGWNLPLIECIACGLPCLTTDNTGQGEFIRAGIYPEELILKSHQTASTGEGGPWRSIDEEELTGKLREIIRVPEKILQLGERCRESIRDFTWENSAKRLGEVLRNLGIKI